MELTDDEKIYFGDNIDLYLEYMIFLGDNNIEWNFKKGEGKSITEMKELIKQHNLDFDSWQKEFKTK